MILVEFIDLNKLRPWQNGRHFPDDIFKCVLFNENVWILSEISLKFVHKRHFNNIPALVQTMAWRRPGESHYLNQWWPSSLTHIWVSLPQWVNQCIVVMQNWIANTRKWIIEPGIPNMDSDKRYSIVAFSSSIKDIDNLIHENPYIDLPGHRITRM